MKLNISKTRPNPNKGAQEVRKHIQNALVTYGMGKMAGIVKIIEKWLVDFPSEPVLVSCLETIPSERVSRLLSEFNIEYKVVKSIHRLSDVSAYFLTIPPLYERPEDLPLVTELAITEHLRIYPQDFTGIHPSYIPVFYFLCHKYVSPTDLRTPILTEDSFVGLLRKALSENIINVTALEKIPYSYKVNKIEVTKCALRPFTLLEDRLMVFYELTLENAANYAWEDDEIFSGTLSSGKRIFAHRTYPYKVNVKSIASTEFRRFYRYSNLSSRDRAAKKLIDLNSLQGKMINVGRKCIPGLEELRIIPIPNICSSSSESLRLLAQTNTKARKSKEDSGLMKFFETDSSIVCDGKKYTLRSGSYYDAAKIIAQQMLAGNPSVGKDFVFESCGMKSESIREGSVPKWFRKSGGDPKKFVEDGHLLSDRKGNCSLNVDKDCILIFAHKSISKYDDV